MSKLKIKAATMMIESAEIGQLFIPSDLQEKFGLTDKELKDLVIIPLLVKQMLIPVYKLNTTEYVPNEWSPNLSGLSRSWRLKTGKMFDGSHPKNVLIAFKRQ